MTFIIIAVLLTLVLLAAIGTSAVLKYREQEQSLSLRREAQEAERVAALPADLAGALKQLLAERASLVARVENLEAIIAAQAAAELPEGRPLPAHWDELSPQEQTDVLAQRQANRLPNK